MILEWVLFKNEFIPVATWYQSKVYSKPVISEWVYWGFHSRTKYSFWTWSLKLEAWSSVDSVTSVIVKTVFVLILLFDIGKVCRTKISTKNKYLFVSFNNNRRLSLEDKTKDYVDINIGGQVCSLHEVTQLGYCHGEILHIWAVERKK